MQLSPELVHSFARSNAHLQWHTEARKRPFTFQVSDKHITFRISTNNERPISIEDLHRICETFNKTQSLKPVDYQGITHNSSYVLAIFKDLLASSKSRPIVSSDLDAPDPKRVHAWVNRIVRDTELATSVKEKHQHICQICAGTIELPDGTRYAEAHHIHPLSGDHKGKDVIENIICVCPNCHAKCDLGAIPLELDSLRCVDGHNVSTEFVAYHNDRIHAHLTSRG